MHSNTQDSLPASRAHRPEPLSLPAIESLIGTLLAAHRAGTLQETLGHRPRLVRWLRRRYLGQILGAAGDLLHDDVRSAQALTVLLRWAVLRLRPDRGDTAAPIDRQAWLERTSWRPFLAVVTHFGFAAVPDFGDRYRRRPDEPAVENLCGLWAIGTSTFYRYLDKGKRQIAESLHAWPPEAGVRMSLRAIAHAEVAARTAETDPEAWHRRQIELSLARRDVCSALWHALRGHDAAAFIEMLRRHRVELSGDGEVDLLVDEFLSGDISSRQRFDVLISLGALWRTRNAEDRARQVYEDALLHANRHADKMMLGIVYGALGKFHETRDSDKARACLEDSAEFLRQASMQGASPDSAEARAEYLRALQRLAWLNLLQNDPRARTVLDTAQALRASQPVPEDVEATLEQAWGEYWRREARFRRALEHKHRALNIYERLGDRREVLSTYNNLAILYVEINEYELAADYANRVVQATRVAPIDPYLLTSALGNLGIARFWQERYEDAIAHYRAGLDESLRAGLPVLAHRAHYNLAEAYYKRFLQTKDPADERAGDHHIAQTLNAPIAERDPQLRDVAPNLKTEILGVRDPLAHERMLPPESAQHFEEMAIVQRNRATLALPAQPADHIRAHLAIANAYLAISTKEREAALELIRQHGLDHEFDSEIDALQITFSRELTKEKVLHAQWKQKSYGVLTEERASSVLKQVLEAGSINKSGYAQLCQVGLATASKHLGTLAERGLLVQTGKGPSTRYVLPT